MTIFRLAIKSRCPAGEPASSMPAMRTAEILFVEDEPDIPALGVTTLREAGYGVQPAANGDIALALLGQALTFGLLVTAVVMPGMLDGLALARRLREIRPDLPVLLATGYSDAAVNVRGDFPILRTPYEIHQLSQAIAKLTK